MRTFLMFFIFMFLPLSVRAATCDAGYAFNISSDSCNTCAPGKYSDGTAMILDPENDIPNSFIPEHPDSGSTWSINFDNTTVSGVANCSTSPDTFVGDVSGDYCWCKITTTTDVNWVYVYDYGYAEDGYCAATCSHACAYYNYRYENIRSKIYPSAGCKSCTNAPANAHYTGSGTTATNCPWVCDAGYYDNNGVCTQCTNGYYCPGDGTMVACPPNTLTPQEISEHTGADLQSSTVGTYVSSHAHNNFPSSQEDCYINFISGHIEGEKCLFYQVVFHYSTSSQTYVPHHGDPRLYRESVVGGYLSDYVPGGYYQTCNQCSNAPTNAHYTGAGTPDVGNCPWACDAGYGRTAWDTCEPLCAAGITQLHTSTGLVFNLYANKLTSPAVHIKTDTGAVCYVNLATGATTGAVHFRVGDTVYHTTN